MMLIIVLKISTELIRLKILNLAAWVNEHVVFESSVPTFAKYWSRYKPNAESDGPISFYKRAITTIFLDDINFQANKKPKDQPNIETFTLFLSTIFLSVIGFTKQISEKQIKT